LGVIVDKTKELKVYKPSFEFEEKFSYPVAGLDEVGYGAWAGPVVAAAVVLTPKIPQTLLEKLDDSKRLSAQKREEVFELIQAYASIGIGEASVEEIENTNIRLAALKAMERAFGNLSIVPKAALVDGRSKPNLPCPTSLIIKGDQRSYSIAAASIVAKVYRDRFMRELALEHPEFGWESNVGYGTARHQGGLAKVGVTPWHRKTYAPIRMTLERV
jgi:ribonuclease HII